MNTLQYLPTVQFFQPTKLILEDGQFWNYLMQIMWIIYLGFNFRVQRMEYY